MDYKVLPDHSRVWIYQSNRKLTEDEVSEIQSYGDEFIKEWASHGKDIKAAFQVFYQRFLVLFADESEIKASGCSIDSSVHFIQKIQNAYGLDLFDRLNIAFVSGGQIDVLRMNDFQIAIEKGSLNEDTIVFNNLVETKIEFENHWKVPVKESWHKQML